MHLTSKAAHLLEDRELQRTTERLCDATNMRRHFHRTVKAIVMYSGLNQGRSNVNSLFIYIKLNGITQVTLSTQ